MSAAAVALSLGTVAMLDVGTALAGTPPVTGTGTVSCTSAAGKLGFSPGLNFTGGSPDTVKVKVVLGGCTAAGSNVTSTSFNGKGSGIISTATNDCTSLDGTETVSGSVTIKWKAKDGKAKVNTSTLSITSLTGEAAGTNGNAAFTFSHQGLSGSFAGTLSGELDSGSSAATLAGSTGCGAKKGLKKLAIVAGTVHQP